MREFEPKWFRLDGHEPVACRDLMEWATWMAAGGERRRRVAFDTVEGVDISTIFLGLDLSHFGGPPILFETVVIGGGEGLDGYQRRCSSWKGAEKMHQQVVAMVKMKVTP